MPFDRIIAGALVLLLALLDYMGVFSPFVTKMTEEKKIVEQVQAKREATLNIIGEIGEYRLDEVVKIPCEIKNTGEAGHYFPVEIKVSGPGIEEILPIKRIMLEKGEFQKVTFEYKVPEFAREGDFFATVSIYDRIENRKPVQRFAEDKRSFKLVDGPPLINFLSLGLSAQVGERLNLRIKVKDDRGVKKVRIFYQFPGMSEKKEASMKCVSGNEKDGVWVFVTDPSPETGKFIFSIEAIDSKLQIGTTEEYKIAIVTKK